MASTVLVTGVTGFIASHCVQQLLEAGYQVRGTVRSLTDEVKVKPIKDLDKDGRLELVEADLLKADGWNKAVEGCKYVLHVASPLTTDETTVRTAVEGTLQVFRAAAASTTVDRIVLTSSIAAILDYSLHTPEKVFTEEDWAGTDEAGDDDYFKSKVLAERAAWNFVKQENRGHKFDLAVINPGYVFGPMLHKTLFTSAAIVKGILETKFPWTYDYSFPSCDVRDVAKAHLNAMTAAEASNHRHIIVQQSSYTLQQIGQDLSAEFRPQGYHHVATKLIPNGVARTLLRISRLFHKGVDDILLGIGCYWKLDNSRMKTVLGIDSPIDSKSSVIEMAYSLIDNGLVKRKPGYRSKGDIGNK